MTSGELRKQSDVERLFGRTGALIGMIHLRPLPGAPRFRSEEGMGAVIATALQEATLLESTGFDGLIVENAWDIPFVPPDMVGFETVAAMAVVVDVLRQHVALPIGINCLANAVEASLAVAQAASAQFVRANQWVNAYIANEGLVEGRAGTLARYRRGIGADGVTVWADVQVKLGSHSITGDRSVSEQARDAEFFDADALIVTGSRLAAPPRLDDLIEVRESTSLPLVVGSGVAAGNIAELLAFADAVIVGSALKEGGVWSGSMSASAVKCVAEARDVGRKAGWSLPREQERNPSLKLSEQ